MASAATGSLAGRFRLALGRFLDRVFGAEANPWHHLGALGFYLFWIVTATGVYLYAAFDTSAVGAYASVERLTHEQWYLGGVMRSLHRYASDALVAIMGLHLARELFAGHFRSFRTFSWVSGIALVWLVYASGIGGYWLVWDQLAQFSITATAEWLDWLPLGADAIVRNFLYPIDDRFFSLLIFLHIGIPLLLLACMWLHVQRISHAKTAPPLALGLGTLVVLLAASVLHPATSHAPADPASAQAALGIDWFLMFIHPLQYWSSPALVWALTAGATLVLAFLPLLPAGSTKIVAVVEPQYCNGCARCADDCPYVAIVMQPRAGARAGQRLPQVDANACAGCGICAGACPSSTPFRSTEALTSGIDMPQRTMDLLRRQLEAALRARRSTRPVVVFGCERGANLQALAHEPVIAIPLICVAMLPPSFIEYALRAGSAAVVVNGCPAGECEYRLGASWIEQRLAGGREPHLRASVDPSRWVFVRAGAGEEEKLLEPITTIAAHADLHRIGTEPARLRRRSNG